MRLLIRKQKGAPCYGEDYEGIHVTKLSVTKNKMMMWHSSIGCKMGR
jgi:hypothetical protein